jgi:hypothetical protein
VRVAFDGHQFVDLDAARRANATEVVALQVDEHHVFGAFLRMADQLADARCFVVAGQARARAGDRTRFHRIAADRNQALGRGTDDGPVGPREQAGERRRIRGAQPRM